MTKTRLEVNQGSRRCEGWASRRCVDTIAWPGQEAEDPEDDKSRPWSTTKDIKKKASPRAIPWSYFYSIFIDIKIYQVLIEGPIRRTRGGGWMGADKNSSRRRWRLQQDEHGFQHTTPTHYPSWPSSRSHWSATRPRNQHTTFRAKTHQRAQRKLARLAACVAPVRQMACAGQTGDTGQTGGQSRSGRWLQQPQNKCSRKPQWLP
jgi:hypothetical protein